MSDPTRTALQLTSDSKGHFICTPCRGRNGQIFGGQLTSGSLWAAASALESDAQPHAIHLIYMSAGDPAAALEFTPTVLKIGRTTSVARVDIRQSARHLTTAIASFHLPEESAERGQRIPDVPAPGCLDLLDIDMIGGGTSPAWDEVDARIISVDAHSGVPKIRAWMRWTSPLEHPALHAGAFAWMSDLLLVRTARLGIDTDAPPVPASSLDHSVWFHREFAADQWLMLDASSTVRTGARALSEVRAYSQSGDLVATAVQECLVR